jgi:hypothetical protein
MVSGSIAGQRDSVVRVYRAGHRDVSCERNNVV